MYRGKRKTGWVAVGALLVCGGAGMGALASSFTAASVKWRPVSRWSATTPLAPPAPVDHAAAGRQWAQSAFWSGLRSCPAMNVDFATACEAEMKALKDKPAMTAGSYGGPLLITKVEPLPEREFERYESEPLPVYEPERLVDEEPPTPANYPSASPIEDIRPPS